MKQMVLNDWLHETRSTRKHSAMRLTESAMTMLQEPNNVSSALNVQQSRQSQNAIPNKSQLIQNMETIKELLTDEKKTFGSKLKPN